MSKSDEAIIAVSNLQSDLAVQGLLHPQLMHLAEECSKIYKLIRAIPEAPAKEAA